MANQSRVSSAKSVQAHRAGSTKSSSRTNRMSQSRLNSNSTMSQSRLNSNSTMLVSRPSSNSTLETPPPGVLTKQKILQKHFFTKENGINELEFLCKLKRARLDRLDLHDIDEGMKLLQNASHLYLQHVSLLVSLLVI